MYKIEEMIPHRGSMMLVQEIVEVGGNRCVTASTVSPDWPMCENGSVNSIILIELVAQTAGVNIGWREHHSENPSHEVGWLVGIKKAELYRDRIPLNAKIVITIEENKKDDSYAEIMGRARVESELIGEMELQVFRPGKDNIPKKGIPI